MRENNLFSTEKSTLEIVLVGILTKLYVGESCQLLQMFTLIRWFKGMRCGNAGEFCCAREHTTNTELGHKPNYTSKNVLLELYE